MYIENISAHELTKYIYDENYEIIDLRDYYEYQESHVTGAVHIDVEQIISGHIEMITKRNLILYCDRGGESIRMSRILAEHGYRVKNVIGGFAEISRRSDLLK